MWIQLVEMSFLLTDHLRSSVTQEELLHIERNSGKVLGHAGRTMSLGWSGNTSRSPLRRAAGDLAKSRHLCFEHRIDDLALNRRKMETLMSFWCEQLTVCLPHSDSNRQTLHIYWRHTTERGDVITEKQAFSELQETQQIINMFVIVNKLRAFFTFSQDGP